jgi:hypothetical protein
VWGKIFPAKKSDGSATPDSPMNNPIASGTKSVVGGVGGGILDAIGELALDSIKGIGGMFSDLLGLGANDSASLTGSVPTTAWSGVSQGSPFVSAAPAQPLPYGNPPAGLTQSGNSSDFGGDFLPQAWPPQ